MLVRLVRHLASNSVARAPDLFGLSDRTTEGVFLWPDGSAPACTSWGIGEPNDAAANEDCSEMNLGAAVWNDVPCARRYERRSPRSRQSC